MTTKDSCGLWACPSRCRSAHITGIAHIYAAALGCGVYRATWNTHPGMRRFWAPTVTGLQMKPHEPCTNTLITPSLWWPPWPPGTLLCCPWGPTLLFWKAAPACTAVWGDPIPGAGLCHFGQPAGVPLSSSPVLQPVNHSPGLVSSREGSGSLYHPLIHPSRHFERKKSPTSSSFCLFLKPEWSHTRGIVTKWNNKVSVTETDYCETALMKLRKRNWREKLSVFLCFKHTQTMQDSYLPLTCINFYWFYLLETKHNVQYHSAMLGICKFYSDWID